MNNEKSQQNHAGGSVHFHHGFYEVHLAVADVDCAIDFYVAKLGFELGFRKSESSALLLYSEGGMRWMLGVFRASTSAEGSGRRQHISFRVAEEDADQMISFLRERGIDPVHPPAAPVQGPMNEPIVHGWMPAAAVFFRDPDGHLLELIADLSDMPRPEILYQPLSEWRALAKKAPASKQSRSTTIDDHCQNS